MSTYMDNVLFVLAHSTFCDAAQNTLFAQKINYFTGRKKKDFGCPQCPEIIYFLGKKCILQSGWGAERLPTSENRLSTTQNSLYFGE